MADSIAHAPGIEGAGLLLTLADERVTIRLTRDLWALESQDGVLVS
jgi:4a-hydroxytetrahydrobiopterin dehydratase